MLKLAMHTEDYLTIGNDIVIRLSEINGKRADIVIDAPKSIPIIRGKVLERAGGKRPKCLYPPSKQEMQAK